jgi:DNA phosphorothioation-dependent restriction protein DptG
MSRMKYYPPELYVGVNAILHQVSNEDIEAGNFDHAVVELAEEINHQKWEENANRFRAFLDTAPQVVRDFYKEVGSLHDSGFDLVAGKKGELQEVVVDFRPEFNYGQKVRLTIVCEKLSTAVVFPPYMITEYNIFLYDEFQYEGGVLSYHFFATNGTEYTFDGVKEFKWTKS